MIGRVIRWLKEAIFGWLQKDLYPDYAEKVKQLERDNEVLRQLLVDHKVEAAEIDQRIAERAVEIEASQAEVRQTEEQLDANAKRREQEETTPPRTDIRVDLDL